jgi:2,3-bisphosphoglycerate-dependent phosphoglycerate mutase
LLRHGESVGNAEGYYQGHAEFELTETGRAQVRALAEHWLAKDIQFDAIISSPLARARQSAEIIVDILPAPLEFDPIWMELNNGVLAGLKHEVASEIYPRPDFRNPYTPVGQTGESEWDLYLRAGKAMQSLLIRSPGRYLVVSHGGILNMVLRAMLGITPQANWQGASFRFPNTGCAVVEYHPQRHRWILNQFNDQGHWPANQDLS